MSHIFQFKHLQKSIAGNELLNIEELPVVAGKCTVLSGANGAGKTTLLKILAGLDTPDNVEVYVEGVLTPWKKARPMLRKNVVYVHQTPYLFDASVENNIYYGLKRQGLSRKVIKQRAEEALEWSQLNHVKNRNCKQLSGGERQRVAFARARVLSPKLLLLDEPTANLDQNSRELTYFLTKRLLAEDVSIILTSHEPQEANRLGDHFLCLAEGKIQATPIPRLVMSDERVRSGLKTPQYI